jgi:hypothetical protein
MAIKKNNNQAQNSDKHYLLSKKFWKIFSMEWVLLVCFSYSLHGDFWFDAFF